MPGFDTSSLGEVFLKACMRFYSDQRNRELFDIWKEEHSEKRNKQGQSILSAEREVPGAETLLSAVPRMEETSEQCEPNTKRATGGKT